MSKESSFVTRFRNKQMFYGTVQWNCLNPTDRDYSKWRELECFSKI